MKQDKRKDLQKTKLKKNGNKLVNEKNEVNINYLFHLTTRTCLFFLLLLIVLVLFYLNGSLRQFQDSTQNLVLSISTVISFLLIFFSAIDIIECIIFAFTEKKKKYFLYVLFFIFSGIIGAVVLFALRTLTFITSGL